MRSIFAGELRRFRLPALAAALLHTLPLLTFAVGGDLFLPSEGRLAVAALAYAFAGLTLGGWQIVTYRRGDLWAFLLHRPVPVGRIFLALTGAGALLLGLAVFLPLLLATGLSALGPLGVDPRHFALAPYAWLLALASYLAGVFLALTPWRGAFLTAALALVPWYLASSRTLGIWVFGPALLAVAALAFVTRAAFRPDLSTPPRGRFATALAVAPGLWLLHVALSLALLFAYSFGVIVGEHGVRGFSTFAWNDYFPAGSSPRLSYLDGPEALEHGLRLAGRPASGFDREAVVEVVPSIGEFPRRGQPYFLDELDWLDDWNGRGSWIFRHDRMAFAGRDRRTGRSLGWLEAGGAPLAAVPHLEQNAQVVTPRAVYLFEGGGGGPRLDLRFALPAGERFLAPAVAGKALDLALGDRALYLFAPGALSRLEPPAAPARPFATIPLPGEASNLVRIVASPAAPATRAEAVLVALEFGARNERGFAPARQVLLAVDWEGESGVIANLPLSPGLPVWERHRGFLVSPVLQTADDLTRAALAGSGPGAASLGDLVAHPPPAGVLAGALLLALLSSGATWLLAGRRCQSPGSRRGWTLAALLLGAPVPFALLLYTSRSA